MAKTKDQIFTIETEGNVTSFRVRPKQLLDEGDIETFGQVLFHAADNKPGPGKRTLEVDLYAVENMSSAALAKLIALEEKAHANGDTMVVTYVQPEVFGTFSKQRLSKALGIYDANRSLEEALADKQNARSR